MSKTKKIISLLLTVALIMTMATVAIVSSSALAEGETYAVAGAPGLCGSEWDPSDANNLMTWNAEKGIYEKVFTGIAAGTYEFKVINGTAWDNPEFNLEGSANYGGGNASVTVDVDGSTVIVGCDGTKALVEVTTDTGSDDPVVTTAPTSDDEQPTTAAPVVGDAITVYFTNNKGWDAAYLHYWFDGAEGTTWPGTAMTFVETNDYGESIYSAEVPATVAGIIFNNGQDPADQTVDVLDGIANGTGFYLDEQVDGKWTVGTYEYAVPVDPTTTAAPVATTTAAPVATTTAAPVATTTAAPVVTTTAAGTTNTTAPADNSTGAAAGTAITVNGEKYDVAVDAVVTYVVDLTAEAPFEDIQAVVNYDASKLALTRVTSDDPYTEDWEVEGPAFCPNLDGVILNASGEGVVKFNASKPAGYRFNEKATLITLEFTVIAEGESEIDLVIEEMTIKGGNESYFTGGQASKTEGITVEEYLNVPEIITTASTATTAPVEPGTTVTTAPVEPGTTVTTAPVEPGTTTTTAPVEPGTTTTAPVEPGTTTTAPAASSDATGEAGTTAGGTNGAVDTGVAAYLYVVLAVITMAACAVVVLRKRANG